STTMSKEEIDRMIRDAEQHAAEDTKRREEIETRNQADSLAYQVERQIKELGENIPVHEKARAEQLIEDIRKALKEEADIEQIRTLMNDLQQAAYSISERAYQQQQAAQQAEAGEEAGATGGGSEEDDVVDAEFEEK
ncbi:MAG: Hsp70 family protein, partial [Candidatus Syntropharchaeales archaeon]